MDITLYTRRKIIVYHLPYTLEVHTASHDFCGDHNPAFALPHTTNAFIALFLSHTSMQAIYIRDPAHHKLFRQRGCTYLCGSEDEDRGIIWSCEMAEQTGKLGLVVSDISQALVDERQRRVSEISIISGKFSQWFHCTHLRPTTIRIGSCNISIAIFSAPAGSVALKTAF